jgi:hypothetical protein
MPATSFSKLKEHSRKREEAKQIERKKVAEAKWSCLCKDLKPQTPARCPALPSPLRCGHVNLDFRSLSRYAP